MKRRIKHSNTIHLNSDPLWFDPFARDLYFGGMDDVIAETRALRMSRNAHRWSVAGPPSV